MAIPFIRVFYGYTRVYNINFDPFRRSYNSKDKCSTYARSSYYSNSSIMEIKNFKVGPSGSVNVEKVMEWIKNYTKPKVKNEKK